MTLIARSDERRLVPLAILSHHAPNVDAGGVGLVKIEAAAAPRPGGCTGQRASATRGSAQRPSTAMDEGEQSPEPHFDGRLASALDEPSSAAAVRI